MNFKKFISSRGTVIALLITVIFGGLVFWIYDSGYKNMPSKIKELPIEIINQDPDSKDLAENIKAKAPFKHVKISSDLKKGKQNLDQRKSYLLIAIPAHFKHNLLHGKNVKVKFYLNDSNQMSVSSSLNAVANKMGQEIDKKIQVQNQTIKIAKPQLAKLQLELNKQRANAEIEINTARRSIAQAPKQMQPALIKKLKTQTALSQKQVVKKALKQKQQIIFQSKQKALAQQRKTSSFTIQHRNSVPKGLNNALAPFFINITLNLGTLMGALLLYGVYAKFASKIGRWKSFAYLECTYLLIAFLASLIVSAIDLKILPGSMANYSNIMFGHTLAIFLYYNFNTIALLLLGQIGTPINIILTMIQVVSGAGIIPLIGMNSFFNLVHYVSPVYYGIQSDFNFLYGGTFSSEQQIGFWLLLVGILLVNMIIVTIRHKQPTLKFDELS